MNSPITNKSASSIKDFIEYIESILYYILDKADSEKVDGIFSEFKKAVTRGDGLQGDEVTNNIRTIKSIPLHIKSDFVDNFEFITGRFETIAG